MSCTTILLIEISWPFPRLCFIQCRFFPFSPKITTPTNIMPPSWYSSPKLYPTSFHAEYTLVAVSDHLQPCLLIMWCSHSEDISKYPVIFLVRLINRTHSRVVKLWLYPSYLPDRRVRFHFRSPTGFRPPAFTQSHRNTKYSKKVCSKNKTFCKHYTTRPGRKICRDSHHKISTATHNILDIITTPHINHTAQYNRHVLN